MQNSGDHKTPIRIIGNVATTTALLLIVNSIALFFIVIGCASKKDATLDENRYGNKYSIEKLAGGKAKLIKTRHYIIFTTIQDEKLSTAFANLAEFQYERIKRDLHLETDQQQKIYIFATPAEWIEYTKKNLPTAKKELLKIRSGGYTHGKEAAFYYLGRYATSTILAHELFHLYLNYAAEYPPPAWLNEALACWYEAIEWQGKSPVFTPRKNLFRIQHLRYAYTKKKLIPLTLLLDSSALEISKQGYSTLLIYYAELWGLLVYLQDPKCPYHDKFKVLLEELGKRRFKERLESYINTHPEQSIGLACFCCYITKDIETFQDRFFQYIRKIIK